VIIVKDNYGRLDNIPTYVIHMDGLAEFPRRWDVSAMTKLVNMLSQCAPLPWRIA